MVLLGIRSTWIWEPFPAAAAPQGRDPHMGPPLPMSTQTGVFSCVKASSFWEHKVFFNLLFHLSQELSGALLNSQGEKKNYSPDTDSGMAQTGQGLL